MSDVLFELVESREYTEELSTFGGVSRLDDALLGIHWALATRPSAFPVVAGFKNIRLVKTDEVGVEEITPSLRVCAALPKNWTVFNERVPG
jgi:hypothetical protein